MRKNKLWINALLSWSPAHRDMPKANRSKNPKILLPSVATMLKSSARPGDTHGLAMVPLIAPNK